MLFSLPPGTEMFHFPGFPPHTLCIQVRVTVHHDGRVPPFGHPRINARLTAPRGLSRPPTSFIGSWYQGIHRAPLITYTTYSPDTTFGISRHYNRNLANTTTPPPQGRVSVTRCSHPLSSSQTPGHNPPHHEPPTPHPPRPHPHAEAQGHEKPGDCEVVRPGDKPGDHTRDNKPAPTPPYGGPGAGPVPSGPNSVPTTPARPVPTAPCDARGPEKIRGLSMMFPPMSEPRPTRAAGLRPPTRRPY